MSLSLHTLKVAICGLGLALVLGLSLNSSMAQEPYTDIRSTSVSATSVASTTTLHSSKTTAEQIADLNYKKLNRMCTDGDASACKDLGHVYIKQYHSNQDSAMLHQGYSFFERGCALRDNESCYYRGLTILDTMQHGLDASALLRIEDVDAHLANSLLYGTKLKDREQAADAYKLLAELYQDKDRNKAVEYAQNGCSLDNNDSCYLMAISLWLMQVEGIDISQYLEGREADDVIIAAFNKGTQASRLDYSSNSYYFLGYEYARKQMYENSTDAYKKGCELNNDNACFFTGIAYEDGLGVKNNIKRAYSFYQKACSFGNEYGCERVRKLNMQGIY